MAHLPQVFLPKDTMQAGYTTGKHSNQQSAQPSEEVGQELITPTPMLWPPVCKDATR
ncbi:MAG: hypothetical protein AAGF95_16360 [Chloroflexota bacterium]